MSDHNAIQISVIVPTCHRNDLLAKCLDCLAPGVQTLPADQYEVIVTDDGTRSTAEQLVKTEYPWARWIAGPRRGPAHNRNNGAAEAKGEWLAFTDDDCLPEQDWLAAYLAALSEGVQVYEGKTTCQAGITSPLYQAPVNLTGGCLWSCNFMISSALFHSIGGFDTGFTMPAMEDIDLHERLSDRGHSAAFIEAAVVDHPPRRSASGLKSGKMYEATVQYWSKQGRSERPLIAYAKHLKHHWSCLRQFGLHPDIFPAGAALLLQTFYVVPHLPLWERKYRRLYHPSGKI